MSRQRDIEPASAVEGASGSPGRSVIAAIGIARLGAVTAALSAGEPLRALQLAERFLAEGLAPEVAEKLRQLVMEADAELVRAVTDEPTVLPVTFTLRAA